MTTITETLICDVCNQGPFKNKAGLGAHKRFKHQEEHPHTADDARLTDLEGQLKEALSRAEKAEAEAEEFKPTRDVSSYFMETEKDVVGRFGWQKLQDLALNELATVNRRRAQENLPPIQHTSEEEKEKAIQRIITDLLADRNAEGPPSDGPIPKTLKMVKPDGMLVQLPYEAQINNLAGSLEDAIARYRNKGYKLAVDGDGRTLCPSQNCYNPAVVDGGRNTFGGYCSADHQQRTEGNSRPIDRNVYTRRQ